MTKRNDRQDSLPPDDGDALTKDDPLLASLAELPRLEAPARTSRRTHRRAIAQLGARAPSVVWITLAHAALAIVCLGYLVKLVLAACALYR